jgi:hypothetical protein
MLKRKCILLSIIVVVSLSISPSVQIVRAGDIWGNPLNECIPLESRLSMKVVRDSNTYCAKKVTSFEGSHDCTSGKQTVLDSVTSKNNPRVPVAAISGGGNQKCPEAIVRYISNSFCYSYTTGGNTYYIPPGCGP